MIELTVSASARRQRLSQLLTERKRRADDPLLLRAVRDAQLIGSLALAGLDASPADLAAAAGEPLSGDAGPVARLLHAHAAVDPEAPFSAAAVLTWHQAATGCEGYRTAERSREAAPPPAPPGLIAERLANLEEWMQSVSGRELSPAGAAALAMARIAEIAPFDDGNGRISRLAASHIMVARGALPPIFEARDRERLIGVLGAAFRLETAPLVALLEQASDRSLDVMIGLLAGSE
jgi:Fic family protein